MLDEGSRMKPCQTDECRALHDVPAAQLMRFECGNSCSVRSTGGLALSAAS